MPIHNTDSKIESSKSSDLAIQQLIDVNGSMRKLWEGISEETHIDWTFDELIDYFMGSRIVNENPGPYVGTAVAFLRLFLNEMAART